MRSIKKIACLVFAFASFAQPADAVDDLQSIQMVEQARLWQRKNRDDLAADVWRRLLLIDPKHAEALVNLGVIETHAGNLAEAETLYSRAAQLAPRPAGLKELSGALDTAKGAGSNKLPPQATPPKQARPAEAVANVSPVKPPVSVPVKPASVPVTPASVPVKPASVPANPVAVAPRAKASAKTVTPTESTANTRSPQSADSPQLILSTSLDLAPVKSGP